MSVSVHRCPWGCGSDRLSGDFDPMHAVRCGQCQSAIPSPQVQMFARLKGETVEKWLKERAPK